MALLLRQPGNSRASMYLRQALAQTALSGANSAMREHCSTMGTIESLWVAATSVKLL